MKQLFDLNSPLLCFLSRITDLILLSLLTVLFSIPIITLSPSIIAASKVVQDFIYEEDSSIIKSFFTHFIKNIKQGIFCSIITYIGIGIFLFDIFWLISHQASISILLITVLVIASSLFLGILVRLHLLMARYHNPFRQHLYNAFVFSCWHFTRSVFIAAIASIPSLLFLIYPHIFVLLLPFWFLLFPGASLYLLNLIVKPSFQQIEDISLKNRKERI